MFKFLQFLKSVLTGAEPRQSFDESYLAGAADMCDLERRMRIIDERGRNPVPGNALGLYPR
jgi:hypothetical protein